MQKYGLDYCDFFALLYMCIRDGKLADAAFMAKGNIISIDNFSNTTDMLIYANANDVKCMVFRRIGEKNWNQKTLITNMSGFKLNEKSITFRVSSVVTPDMHRIPQQSRRIKF